MTEITTRPLTPDTWDDIVTVFGGGEGKGDPGGCWCMWWRLPGPGMTKLKGHDVKAPFRERVAAGQPPGPVGYDGGDPVGWIQAGPSADVPEWNRARVIEACPVDPDRKRAAPALYHGVAAQFREAGFHEVLRRRPDRPLMRLAL